MKCFLYVPCGCIAFDSQIRLQCSLHPLSDQFVVEKCYCYKYNLTDLAYVRKFMLNKWDKEAQRAKARRW